MNTRRSDENTSSKNKDEKVSEVINDDLRAWLKDSLKTVESNMISHSDTNYRTLTEKVDKNLEETTKILNIATANKEKIEKLSADLAVTDQNVLEVNGRTGKLERLVETQTIQINVLQRRLEDQTNRSSRKSLVIRGIPEGADEKTWDDTREVVAAKLADILGQQASDISDKIERIHRGRPIRAGKEGPRVVHALFYDWNDSEKLKKDFFKLGRRNQNVYIDQKYGPDTDFRRNKAKECRRRLIEDGTAVKAYVAYPAKLMVKRSAAEKHYSMFEDFSQIPVPIKPPNPTDNS